MALLEVRDLTVRFGGVVALDHVSFDVAAGSMCAVIGPNGAGKTTLFNIVTRVYRATSGSVAVDGTPVSSLAPHLLIGHGVARTFQNLALFRTMTVLDNVLVGDHCRTKTTMLGAAVPMPTALRSERIARDRAREMIDYVGLSRVANAPVAALPFGTQKRVELARALVSKPRLLLLDEPAGGISHEEVGGVADLVQRIHKDLDVTVVLVEHNMGFVMGIADHVVVLDFGRKIAEGPPAAVRQNKAVIEAYLGAA